jgi:peptide/nickel transport system permease protein
MTERIKDRIQISSTSLWLDVWRRMRRNRLAVMGLLTLLVLALLALTAPWVAPSDPYEMDLRGALQPMGSPGHILGTDELGRDTLSRLIYGGRVSLAVGLIVVGIAGGIGVPVGAVSGHLGGLVDNAIMRVVDILMAFPFLLLAIGFVAVVGPSLANLMIVLGGVSWTGYARLTRSLVLAQREEDYVRAARVVGVGNWRIIWRHILPNCLGVITVRATFDIAGAILAASALSFLGLGAQPPTAEWGAMLSTARPFLRQHPILSIAPGMAIMITVLAINLVGDALRDALDPRLRALRA